MFEVGSYLWALAVFYLMLCFALGLWYLIGWLEGKNEDD